MANAARKIRRLRAAGASNEQLMRLVRFPAVRARISAALRSAQPEKVEAGGRLVRFRLADPGAFHPALFATVPVGGRGTLLVIGTRKSAVKKPSALAAFIRRMGRGMKSEARRSLIYQLRRAGIIGGAETQAVLVPRHRVLAAASAFSGRTAANPILATLGFNPLTTKESAELAGEAGFWARRAKRSARSSPRAASYFAGRARGSVDALKRYGIKRAGRVGDKIHRRADDAQFIAERTPAANPRRKRGFTPTVCDSCRKGRRNLEQRTDLPGVRDPKHGYRAAWICSKCGARRNRWRVGGNPGTVEIKVPFRDGQKITPARMRQWIDALPENAITRLIKSRFEKGIAQYKRFHLGSEPTSFTYRAIPMGSQGSRITDVDMVVSEGKEWAAPYQVPKSSGKYDPRVQGRYIHAHGDSKMDVDIRKAAPTKRLPERFHTADGKFVGVVPSRNVKITDWYRG